MVDIFERNRRLGDGFPYSPAGSGPEHVTNVSGNEIPDLPESLLDWLKSKKNPINPEYHITPGHFSDYRVVPRLLFGDYLSDQFDHYLVQAKEKGLSVTLNLHSAVVSITQDELTGRMTVFAADGATADFDKVIICTGHHWPMDNKMPGTNHFESPYPPLKLDSLINMPVRIKGSSLTAVDAMRTIARVNGEFKRDA